MYYVVKVVFTVEDDKGKVKKQIESYLVNAMSTIEADTRTTAFLTERGELGFEVKSVSKSAISTVINDDK